jgi:hypothetical protein
VHVYDQTRCLFLLLFLGALYVAWVLFYVGLFSVRTFFFVIKLLTCVLKVLMYMRDRGSIFLYAAFETGRRSADTAHMQATPHNQT